MTHAARRRELGFVEWRPAQRPGCQSCPGFGFPEELFVIAQAGDGLLTQHDAVDRDLVLQAIAIALGADQFRLRVTIVEAQQYVTASNALPFNDGNLFNDAGDRSIDGLRSGSWLQFALNGHGLGQGRQEGPGGGKQCSSGQRPHQHRGGAPVFFQQHRLVETPGCLVAGKHQFNPSWAWLCTSA